MAENVDVALGQHLRELRANRRLSQAEVARAAGIDVTYLSKLENDRQNASHRVLDSLARVFEVEPGDLEEIADRHAAKTRVVPAVVEADPFESLAPPPRFRTSFIDRAEDRERLRMMLEAAGALVSVSGPPGGGKTRLLAEVLADFVRKRRPVAWITISEHDAGRIESVCRRAVALARERHPGGLIVALDDADHDLDACTDIARRVIADGATVVATSRQPLRVYGQQHLRLPALPRPDRHQRPAYGDGPDPDLKSLHDQESVQLFMDRAALARPEFQLDRANAPAVFDVCRWLDGLPLAIELAALRLGQMTVADLAASIGDLLNWLTRNTPDVPARHASLATAIGWSFDRLDDRQRDIATRLSVFDSTFTLDDAVSIAVDDQHPRGFVEATVMDLVECSLLVMRENADKRAVYRWLSPIKQYGRILLERGDAEELTIERHRSWLRQVVDSLETDLPRRESEWERLAELTPELVSAVYDLPPAEQASAMNRIADALSKSLMFGNHIEHVNEYSRLFTSGGPEVLRQAGMVARVRGDFREAHENLQAAYRIAVTNRDEAAQANVALDMAENFADLSQYDEAKEYVGRASSAYEKLGDDRGRIEVLNLRGKLEQETGDLSTAERWFRKALLEAEKVEDRRLVAYSQHSLGVCDYLLRRVASARVRLEESLRVRDNMRNQRGAARVIEAFALIESEVRNHELALQLIGAARQYRRSSGVLGVSPWWHERLERAEQEARVSLVSRPEAADQALLDGVGLTLAAAGETAATTSSSLPSEPLGDPMSRVPLRRPIGMPFVATDRDAASIADAARDQGATDLDEASRELVAAGGSAPDAYRRLHRAKLLAIAEPIGARIADLACFAVDPLRYRGVVVPVFASGRALAAAIDRRPEWASRPVVEIRLEQLRASLGRGETAVVNPWTPLEFRISSAETGYATSIEVSSSIEAPTPARREVSAS